ncbi:hypothetical protein Q4Q49_18670 [Shewanella sp. SP1S1-7]|uniref:hypothetical protein n=1 Tax=Shewanella sp. SP1S1-7 TaxID=3063536 RepID=UPI00289150EF|nr:hypothetical protein [Shewanella sp. SP1S1-7]MDT3337302.1 hypothetical protein [Shewanella sp. SP1S1-7]
MVAEFATIVGLLSAFSSGRTGNKQIELNEFLVWLMEHNHEDIKQAIEANHATTLSIQTIFNRGLVDVHEKLDTISECLAILASRSDGIEGLALAYVKEAISDQALDILKLMEENDSEFFLLSNATSDIKQRIVLCPGPNFLCNETRFFQDDLQLMLGLGLLVVRYNSRGNPLYCYTRAASKLVRSIV